MEAIERVAEPLPLPRCDTELVSDALFVNVGVALRQRDAVGQCETEEEREAQLVAVIVGV